MGLDLPRANLTTFGESSAGSDLPTEIPFLKEGEAALHQAPALIDFLPIGVYACDVQGRVLWFNQQAARLWGRSSSWAKDQLFCGSHRLYDFKGEARAPQDGAMAVCLKSRKPLRERAMIFERPDGSRVQVVAHVEPVFDGEARLIGAVSCFYEAREQSVGERQARELLDGLPAAIYTTDATGHLLYYNDAAAELWGRRPVLGNDQWCGSWRLYWPDGRPMNHDECPMAVALRSGKPVRGAEAIAERPDGTRIPFIPYPTPILDGSGETIAAVNMLVDITDRKRAEEQQRILLDELNHRVKNSLATVQSLATQTLGRWRGAKSAVGAFEDRLFALARAHDQLTREQWHSADLKSIIEDAIAPYRTTNDQIVAEGPSLRVAPRVALMLAMVVHELATNAAKYGSLSLPGGSLHLAWRIDAESTGASVALEWSEKGGPLVKKPRRRGFGTRLIERSIRHEMSGSSEIVFAPEGLRCSIRLPLS